MSDEKKTISTINIGEVLKAAREEKGLSIPTAALHCNLEASIIEKLEDNQFAEIGAPVFTRGYLNLYARCLGLNENEISEAFNQLKTSHNPTLQLSEMHSPTQRKPFKRRGLSKWLLFIPVLLILGWALQQLLSSDSWLIKQLNKALVSTSTEEKSGEKNIVLTVGNEQKEQVSEVTLTSSSSPETNATTENTTSDLTTTANLSPTSTAIDDTPTSSEITLTSLTPTTENTLTEEKPIEEPELTVADDNKAIELSFPGGESWIQINDVNKKIVKTGGIKKGEVITLPASGAPYNFNIGRPENVELKIYGKAENLSKYQRSGSTRRFNVSLPNG